MKKVLFITYLYPPLDCGVCRQLKVAKYIPLYEWTPVILSVKKSHLRPRYDRTLMKDISLDTSVYRTFSFESKILMRGIPHLLHISQKYLQIPDHYIGWLPFAVMKGLKIIKKENINVLFSTSMPNTCHLVALILKKMTQLPWVADFRESWTQNPFIHYPAPILKIENKMEAAIVKNANALTMINDPIRDDLASKYPDYAYKCVTISHGFDPEDFQLKKTTNSKKFTILYAGSLYGRRSSRIFLKVIKDIIEEDEEIRNTLRIQFVGDVNEAQDMIDHLALTDVVQIKGYVSHEEVYSLMVEADVLLLIIGAGQGADKISTGKLFHYLASGTPILALAPEGVATDVIKKTCTGISVHPDDEHEIKNAVIHLFQKYKRKKLQTIPNKDVLHQYDIRVLSKNFTDIFNLISNNKESDNSSQFTQ